MNKNKVLRVFELIFGTCCISFGIAFQSKANIGMSPLSSFPFVLSCIFGFMTLGNFVLLWNVLFALLQIPLEGKKYKLYCLTQIPLAFLLGYVTDFAKWCIQPINCNQYYLKVIVTLLGVVFIAFGVCFTVRANLIMNGPEAFLTSLSKKSGVKFGTLKTAFDCCNIILASLLSFFVFHRVVGIGIGTVLAAGLTGIFINLINRFLDILKKKKADSSESARSELSQNEPALVNELS